MLVNPRVGILSLLGRGGCQPAMLTHLLAADGRYGPLNLAPFGISEEMVKKFGDSLFRRDQFKNLAHTDLPFGDGKVALKDGMPTKPVRLPPSRF